MVPAAQTSLVVRQAFQPDHVSLERLTYKGVVCQDAPQQGASSSTRDRSRICPRDCLPGVTSPITDVSRQQLRWVLFRKVNPRHWSVVNCWISSGFSARW